MQIIALENQDRFNARSLKNFPAPTVRSDFNQHHSRLYGEETAVASW
jgi:hypothetical protein